MDVSQQSSMLLLARIYRAIEELNAEAIDQLLYRENISWLKLMPELLLLHIPAHRGYEHVIRVFLGMGAAVDSKNERGETALHLAAEDGDLAILELLVAQKVDLNARTWIGMTPLMLAAHSGRTAVVEFLLDHGAEIGECRDEGEVDELRNGLSDFALSVAVERGHTEIAKVLLERGADANISVNGTYFDGGTLLHLLAHSSGTSIWRLLTDQGVSLELEDSTGDTALVLAVRLGRVDTVRYLLEIGADPRALPRDVTPKIEWCDWDDSFARGVELVMEAQRKLQDESTTS